MITHYCSFSITNQRKSCVWFCCTSLWQSRSRLDFWILICNFLLQVIRYVLHPDFEKKTLKNDIALVSIRSFFGQVCIPTCFYCCEFITIERTDIYFFKISRGGGGGEDIKCFFRNLLKKTDFPSIFSICCKLLWLILSYVFFRVSILRTGLYLPA